MTTCADMSMNSDEVMSSEDKQLLKQIHKQSSRHVLVLESTLSSQEICQLFALADRLRIAGNELASLMSKRYDQLIRTKKYRALLKHYGKDDKDKRNYAQQLKQMQESYDVTWDFCRKTMQSIQVKYQIDAVLALTKAEAVWQGVEACLYSNGKTIHTSDYGHFPALIAKQINKCIILKVKDGALQFKYGSMVFGAKINDTFQQEEANAVIHYLTNQSQIDKAAIDIYKDKGTCISTYRPCYVSLVPKIIRGKQRIYIHICIEGKPKDKLDKNGQPRHTLGKGNVGVDLGPRSIAVTHKDGVLLENIRYVGKNPEDVKADIANLQSAIDKSINANNGISNNCKKKKKQLKDLRRKKSINSHLGINNMVHQLRSFGDTLIIEGNNASALAKRAKRIVSSNANSNASCSVILNQGAQSHVQQQSSVTQSNSNGSVHAHASNNANCSVSLNQGAQSNVQQQSSVTQSNLNGSAQAHASSNASCSVILNQGAQSHVQQQSSVTQSNSNGSVQAHASNNANCSVSLNQGAQSNVQQQSSVTQSNLNGSTQAMTVITTQSSTNQALSGSSNGEHEVKGKKRHGSSINKYCMGYAWDQARRTFLNTDGQFIIVPRNYRASQYDHTADTYTKRKLSDRMITLADGTVVQRDCYSSFLLYCYSFDNKTIDKDKCKAEFARFLKQEQDLIAYIKANNITVFNSGI